MEYLGITDIRGRPGIPYNLRISSWLSQLIHLAVSF
jgi:hypothetical protein